MFFSLFSFFFFIQFHAFSISNAFFMYIYFFAIRWMVVCGKVYEATCEKKTIIIEYRTHRHIRSHQKLCVCMCVFIIARVQNESESKSVYKNLFGCLFGFLCLFCKHLSLSLHFFLHSFNNTTLIDLNEKHFNKKKKFPCWAAEKHQTTNSTSIKSKNAVV